MTLLDRTSPMRPDLAVSPVATPQAPPFQNPLWEISEEKKLELLEYWRSVLKRKWMILGLAFFAALLASVVAFSLTPYYRSTATVLIETGNSKLLSIEDIYGNGTQREFYQSQVEIMGSRAVAERTAVAMKLWDDPAFDPRKADQSWFKRLASAVGTGGPETEWTDEDLRNNAVARIEDMVNIQPVRLSQLVKVNAESTSPALSARIANTLATQYIEADRASRLKLSQDASSVLVERLGELRDALTESERALQDYRDAKGIVSLSGSAQTAVGQQIGDSIAKLTEVRARRLELESRLGQMRAANGGSATDAPAELRDPLVTSTLNNLSDARRKLADASLTLGPRHPKILQLEADVAQLTSLLSQQRSAAVASLTRDYRAALANENALQRAVTSAKDAVQGINREEFQLTVLEREVQTNRQLFDLFMKRAKETDVAGDVQSAVARVVDRAVPVGTPVRPNKSKIVLTWTVLALLLGAVASLLLDRLDNTVKGADDAESRLRQPVLAALPMLADSDRHLTARLFVDQPESHFSEAVRTARTGVLLSSLDLPRQILLITSSVPGEGKTTLAINLALAHAQTKPTLLLDCDMRRAQISRSLGIQAGAKGLTNFVAGSTPRAACTFKMSDSMLHVMPIGDLPPQPLELLMSQRFKEALKILSNSYEMIVIDSPPVELVSDALVLAPMSTGVAFVVKAMATPTPVSRKSLSRLQRAGANILGLLVNQLDFTHAQRYYGQYAAGEYGNYGGYRGASGAGVTTSALLAIPDSTYPPATQPVDSGFKPAA